MGVRGQREGPETIPAHEVRRQVEERTVCHGCRYHDSHTEGNVCGGFGGRVGPTVYTCSHPDAMHYLESREPQLEIRTPDRGTPREIWRTTMYYGVHGTPD